jgi:hypothetical protein
MDRVTNYPCSVRLFKTLVKWSFVLSLLAAIGGAIAFVLLAAKKKSTPVSVEEWPEVPQNPAVNASATF